MNLDERLRRHLSEQADRFDLAATPTVGAVSAQATHRRRRRAAAIGIGILAGAAGTFAVALVGRDDVVRPPAVAVAPTATAAVEQPPLTSPPASRPLDEASVTVRPGQAEVADVELRHTATYPELVQLSVDAEGFLLADPFARALLRSEDGERWTDLDPDLPDSLVSAPSASVGAQHAVFGGVRPGLSAPWSRSNLVAAFSADLTHWRLTDLPVPMTTPQRVEDVVVFEGTTGEFVALGSLTVDFEALVWERLSDEVRAELLRALEGSASYSQWVLVVDGDRVAIELHRFAAGAVRVLYESTVDELGLRDFVGANGPHSQRRYVAWTLGPDGLPEARRVVGLPLTDIIGSGRMGDSVWALGTERDGSAALYRSADGVHWTPVDLDLAELEQALYLLVEPFRLTVYGIVDDLVVDFRSDDGDGWRRRVIWNHDEPIRRASGLAGSEGERSVTLAVSAGPRAGTTVLATTDGGANWRLVNLEPGAEVAASSGTTLLVRQPSLEGGANPYHLSRIELID